MRQSPQMCPCLFYGGLNSPLKTHMKSFAWASARKLATVLHRFCYRAVSQPSQEQPSSKGKAKICWSHRGGGLIWSYTRQLFEQCSWAMFLGIVILVGYIPIGVGHVFFFLPLLENFNHQQENRHHHPVKTHGTGCVVAQQHCSKTYTIYHQP